MIELRLYTRPGCHLCDEMKAAIERAASGLEVRLVEIDVETDPVLESRYGNDVPVLLVNGEKAFEHRASEDDIRRRLNLERGESRA